MKKKRKPNSVIIHKNANPLFKEDGMLATGLVVTTGRQRIGKTSFNTALIVNDARRFEALRIEEQRKFIEQLVFDDRRSYRNVKCPRTCYFSRDEIYLDVSARRETLHMDVSDFGLPDEDNSYGFQYLLPYSVMNFPEIDLGLSNRTWSKDSKRKQRTFEAFKLLGHNNLTVIGDTQSMAKVDKAARDLVMYEVQIKNLKHQYEKEPFKLKWLFNPKYWGKKRPWRRVRSIWTYDVILHQEFEMARIAGLPTDEYVCRNQKLVFEGDIYKYYQSNSCRALFYLGMNAIETKEHPGVMHNLSQANIKAYAEANKYDGEGTEDE